MTSLLKKGTDFINNKPDSYSLIAIICVTFLAYFGIFFGHEFLTYDDNWYIYENENVINLSWDSIVNIFTSIQGGQYSPLAEVYHAILYSIFGKNAIAFKFFALLTHLLNTALVFKLFKQLSTNKGFIVFVSLVFAIHPMQVETIGWISVIFRIATTFMLLGFLYYCKYLENGFSKKQLFFVLLFYILALFTKEQAILFPIGLLLINFKKDNSLFQKRIYVENIIFGTIAIAFGLITLEITKHGGPSVIERNVSLVEKFYLLSETILSYFYNFLFPFKLSFSYPYPIDSKNSMVAGKIFAAFGFLALSIYGSYKSKKLGFGFLWAFGFLSLAFAFSFFHLRDAYMADRYIYIAIIGFACMFFYAINLLNSLFFKNIYFTQISLSLFIITLMTLTFNRVQVFKNSKTLWTNALEVDQNNPYANNSLGFYYRTHNQLDSALVHYKKAIEINPTYYLAHSNIGKVYFGKNQYDKALIHVSKALELNPNYETAYKNRVAVILKINDLKHYGLLISDLTRIIKLNPNETKYLIERAKAYFKLKKYNETIADAKELIKLSPNDDFAYYIAGHSYLISKNSVEAENYLTQAIDLNSKKGSYFFFRSVARVQIKKYKEAFIDVAKAKQLGHKVNPTYFKILSSLAIK